jgi:phage host-nuclease inhibitor protein Gam
MATVVRIVSAPVPSVRSKNDLVAGLGTLGEARRELAELDTRIAAEVATVTERYAAEREALKKRVEKLADRIARYSGDHQAELLGEGIEKTVTFPTGSLSFYFGPTAVETTDDEAAIEWCEKHRLTDAVRVTTTLDREWIEKNRDKLSIPGVSFVQGEFLRILPVGEEKGLSRKLRTIETD